MKENELSGLAGLAHHPGFVGFPRLLGTLVPCKVGSSFQGKETNPSRSAALIIQVNRRSVNMLFGIRKILCVLQPGQELPERAALTRPA